MAWELLFWILCFLIVGASVAIIVYQLLCLSDVEYDFINPYDFSSRFNKFTIPEFAVHGTLSALFLVCGYWFMFLLNLPLLAYNIRLYHKNRYLVHVTEVFNQLQVEKKLRIIKLAFYLTLICIVIYRLVLCSMEYILDASLGGWEGSMHDM